MSGINITIRSGGSVDLAGAAIGHNAQATNLHNATYTVELPRRFDELAVEVERLSASGVLPAPATQSITEQVGAARKILTDESATPSQKEAARGMLETVLSQFRSFCSEQNSKGVFSCIQAIAAVAGLIPFAVPAG